MSLPVAGQSSVREALRTQFKAETLTGDNAVYCESCERKSSTRIQECITTLPQLLVLHLNRFTVDFDDGGRVVKLNNRITFPRRLDMRPFTSAGLAERERAAGTTAAVPGEVAQGDAAPDDEHADYELVGALVHRGTAQDGHYYSFIKDRGDCGIDSSAPLTGSAASTLHRTGGTNKWYRFDDASVTAFDPRNLGKETFGGTVTVVERQTAFPYYDVQVERPVLHNALMLFYERRPLTGADPALQSTVRAASGEPSGGVNGGEPVATEGAPTADVVAHSRSALLPVLRQIDLANHQSALQSFSFDPALQRFLAAAADDAITRAAVDAGVAAAAVAAWQKESDDRLMIHVRAATAPPTPAAAAGVLRSSPSVPPVPRPAYVPLLPDLVHPHLSDTLARVGVFSELAVHARVASAIGRDGAPAKRCAAYVLGAPGSSLLGTDGALYLQSSPSQERRKPSPLFRLLVAVFLEVRRNHDTRYCFYELT